MKEKNLTPEHAEELAQHVASGRIRLSELGSLTGVASQEQMVCCFMQTWECIHNRGDHKNYMIFNAANSVHARN